MKSPAKILFFSTAIFFGLGIFWRSFINLGTYFTIFLGILALALILYLLLVRSASGSSPLVLVLLAVLSSAFFFGVARFDFSDNRVASEVLEESVNQKVALQGIVIREPILKDNYRQIIIEPTQAEGTDGSGNDNRVLLYAPFYPEVQYGDLISVFGKIDKPSKFQTERGGLFDYARYLSKDDIYYTMFYPTIELVEEGRGNVFFSKVFAVKFKFLNKIQEMIPEPNAALMGGILLGTEESLGDELLDDFRKTGLIHIVVLSGFNVAIVAVAIGAVFGFFLGSLWAGVWAVLGIVVFAVMVGLSATVVRASIMAVLAIMARGSGRIYDAGRGLMIAGAIMVLHNPKILAFDASFQLSFVATLGLIYMVPVIEPYFKSVTEKFGLREILMATISAQFFVLPLILYKMGLFSVVSLPVNILVLPVIPLAMLAGFLAGAVAFISQTIALPFAYMGYFILEYVLRIVEWSADLKFASFEIGLFPAWIVALVYGLYAWILFWLYGRGRVLEKGLDSPNTEASRIASQIKIIE